MAGARWRHAGLPKGCFEQPIEAAWNTYRSIKPSPPPLRVSGAGVVPVAGGGAFSLRGEF
jgi:hypothetical protein